MPDINPAELSRPAVSLSTPTLSNKTITVSTPSTTTKATKTSQIIPPRIDLEPIYAALKSAIGNEQWTSYKDATTQFFIGQHMLNPLALTADLTKSHRPPQPDRILRAHRSHNYLSQWREGAPTQPAPGCTIRQCHPGDARSDPGTMGQRKRQAGDRRRKQARVWGCGRATSQRGGHATAQP